MNFLTLLPLAFVMIAGPQILSAVFLATSANWAKNSALYVFGASLSITLTVTAAYYLLNGVSDEGASNDALYVAVLALLIVAAVHTFLGRKTAKPPKWMGTLQTASGKLSFKLGFLLLGIFPTDILTSVAVGTYLAAHGDPWIHALPFIGLTLLLVATPALMVVALGHRAQTILPKVRDWMNDNSWVVNEVVIGFFILITLNSLA
jgi:hypothetical protein